MHKLLAALLIAGCTIGQANATLIVDTGAPNVGKGRYALYSWQYFAGQFSIGAGQKINAIESYFSAYNGGTVSFAIHANGGNRPGALLFSADRSVGHDNVMNWHGVADLGWELAAGDYWVSIKPDANIAGSIGGSAANPMAHYAQGAGDYEWWDFPVGSKDFIQMGVRIDASPSATAVPEPGSLALVALALGTLGLMRRRQSPRTGGSV